ncbi:ankyrin repeat-containing protein At5g02620-like [Cornus florida]|uniref:ankyrin repeat-containing protein At5g02620-like n=1 Tax=Cornus florida TaxID=4283 RepID=UPI002899C82D|nr:ankyrin repeat-containing protein At5g02620-like [Cornus florida]
MLNPSACLFICMHAHFIYALFLLKLSLSHARTYMNPIEKHTRNKELYNALLQREGDKVIQLCQGIPEGPLYILTIRNDTVLHMAIYSEQTDLVLRLLKLVPESHLDKMTLQNDSGRTILHEAASSDRNVPAAREMLRKSPKLLAMRTKRGDTALFRAAREGQTESFKFLDGEVNKIFQIDGREETRNAIHQRDDKTTTLHISVLTESFGLALLIARKYQYLVDERDGYGMTALQLLACNPSAFRSGGKHNSLKRLIYTCVVTEDTPVTEEVESCYRVPLWETIRKQKKKHEAALRLAKFLIEKDTSWEATSVSAFRRTQLKTHKYGGSSAATKSQGVEEVQIDKTSHAMSTKETAGTPLFLATKVGIIEIVEEILNRYPQAVEHRDDEGRSILHVAIQYRQMHIFDLVQKMEIPMMRLMGRTDKNGNSVLHMVGMKETDRATEDTQSPALLLQEDLLLFERVQKISATYYTNHCNSQGQTAEELFATNMDRSRKDAIEWLKRTAENCSIVSVLIATVAFAAAYTVPGGPNQSTGYPILLNQPLFVIFTITDVLSLTFSLTSVVTFLSILTSAFRLKDFKQSLPQKLLLGVTFLIFSISMMMLAFGATVILTIRNKEYWTRIALYSVAFLPVNIFALSYLPLYMSLMRTFKYSIEKIGQAFPRFSINSRTIKSQARSSTISTYPSATLTTHSLV